MIFNLGLSLFYLCSTISDNLTNLRISAHVSPSLHSASVLNAVHPNTYIYATASRSDI